MCSTSLWNMIITRGIMQGNGHVRLFPAVSPDTERQVRFSVVNGLAGCQDHERTAGRELFDCTAMVQPCLAVCRPEPQDTTADTLVCTVLRIRRSESRPKAQG